LPPAQSLPGAPRPAHDGPGKRGTSWLSPRQLRKRSARTRAVTAQCRRVRSTAANTARRHRRPSCTATAGTPPVTSDTRRKWGRDGGAARRRHSLPLETEQSLKRAVADDPSARFRRRLPSGRSSLEPGAPTGPRGFTATDWRQTPICPHPPTLTRPIPPYATHRPPWPRTLARLRCPGFWGRAAYA
jgi:hypothetical protein